MSTVVQGRGQHRWVRATNVSDKNFVLHEDTKLGIWLTKDRVPRAQGFVSVGSRRYAEWQNLAYQATTDEEDPGPTQENEYEGPLIERPQYKSPEKLLLRTGTRVPVVSAVHGVQPTGFGPTPADNEVRGDSPEVDKITRAVREE